MPGRCASCAAGLYLFDVPRNMSKSKQHSQDHEEARTPLQAVVLADSFTQARRARRSSVGLCAVRTLGLMASRSCSASAR